MGYFSPSKSLNLHKLNARVASVTVASVTQPLPLLLWVKLDLEADLIVEWWIFGGSWNLFTKCSLGQQLPTCWDRYAKRGWSACSRKRGQMSHHPVLPAV